MLTEQKTSKELIKSLREAETYLHSLATKIGKLGDVHELPAMVAEIKKLKVAGKAESITTEWLQKKFKIGYTRAANLMDELKAKKVIK